MFKGQPAGIEPAAHAPEHMHLAMKAALIEVTAGWGTLQL